MRKLASCVFFILCCSLALAQQKAARRCLREKVITFPDLAAETYVQLHPNETADFSGITACLRFYTDDASYVQCPFSLATPTYNNDFTISWSPKRYYQLNIHNAQAEFKGLSFHTNQWNSICATWDATTGLGQVFVNGVPSIKKTVGPKEAFKGAPRIILGQRQSSYTGGFGDMFTGFISDVHVYKEVLTPRLIKNYMEAKNKYKLGDYINWHNLKFTTAGAAQVQEKQDVTFYIKEEQS